MDALEQMGEQMDRSKFKDSNNEEYFKMMMEAMKNLTSERNSMYNNVNAFIKSEQPNIDSFGREQEPKQPNRASANDAATERDTQLQAVQEMDFITHSESHRKVALPKPKGDKVETDHEEVLKRLSIDSVNRQCQ